jgi:hypothetical protein
MIQADTLKPDEAPIVALAAQGKSSRTIANAPEVSVSHSTVNRITQRHKELIQKEQAKLIDATLSTITDQTIREINLAKTLTDEDLLEPTKQQALSRIDKKAEMILKSTGIAPSHAPSIHIQQIFNDNSKTLISPQVSDLLGGQLDSIIDVDYEEVPDDE